MPNINFKSGDIIYSLSEKDNKYRVYKILEIDYEHGIFHLMFYLPVELKPTLETVDQLQPYIFHMPIGNLGDVEVLGNFPPTDWEMQGYREHMRLTKSVTEEDLQKAVELFDQAVQFTKSKRFHEAVKLYEDVVDLVPHYWEALDNKAIIELRDLGNYSAAAIDFERSLDINPDNFTAHFGLGQSYFFDGRYDHALKEFEEALKFGPRPEVEVFLLKTRLLRGTEDLFAQGGLADDYEERMYAEAAEVSSVVETDTAINMTEKQFEDFCREIDKKFPEFANLPETKKIFNDEDRRRGYVYLGDLIYYLIERGKFDDQFKEVINFVNNTYNDPETGDRLRGFIRVVFFDRFLRSYFANKLDQLLTSKALEDYHQMRKRYANHQRTGLEPGPRVG